MAKDNFSYNKEPLDDDFISRIMADNLSENDHQKFSETSKNEALWADAIEGLENFPSMDKARRQAFELNQKLAEQLRTKKEHKKPQLINTTTIVWISIILVILIIFLAFHIIRIHG